MIFSISISLNMCFWVPKRTVILRELLLCLCLRSHQQLRSYGDKATALSLIRQTGKAGNQTCNPCFTRQTVYPLHHSGESNCSFEYVLIGNKIN